MPRRTRLSAKRFMAGVGGYCIAAWLSRADQNGSLSALLKPNLAPPERAVAQVEGWILGVRAVQRTLDLSPEGIKRHSLH
jgi:hypothetical protein